MTAGRDPRIDARCKALLETAEELRIKVFEYRSDPNNPAVLNMIVDALLAAFKSGHEFAKQKLREDLQRYKPLN